MNTKRIKVISHLDWTAKLFDSETLQCMADAKRDELREDGICTDTEYETVKVGDNKGSVIL